VTTVAALPFLVRYRYPLYWREDGRTG
jgi:hypothetical protein